MKNKNSSQTLKTLLLTLVLIFCAFLLTYIVTTFVNKPTPQSNNAPTPNPTIFNESTDSQDTAVYTDTKNGFSFSYPVQLKPLVQSNGVALFLSPQDYETCAAGQQSSKASDRETCFKAIFILTGLASDPKDSYDTFASSAHTLSNFTDDKKRKWSTDLVLGQVYNFSAFAMINNKPVRITFQYGFADESKSQEVQSFFERILSTFELQ